MSKITRRRFLEDSLIATTTAAAAVSGISSGVLPHLALAQTSANEKVGMMVVGCGGRGHDHINAFTRDPRVAILYLCDPDPRRVKQDIIDRIAESQDGLKPIVIPDLRKGLDDKNVETISCATTNHWHALTGIWAMEAGKHCYIEKPICFNIHEGKALAAASKKYNRVVQTGTQCRSANANIEAVAFVQSGGIGEVKFARGLCYKRRASIGPLGEYKVPEGVDYDVWSGPAPILPQTRPRFDYDWHWQRQYGNGDLGNQGPHQTDIARWHLGIERFPNSVVTYGGRLGYQAEKDDENFVDAGDTANTEVSIYDYGDKCIVFETRGLDTPALSISTEKGGGAKVGVIIYGSEGYVVQSEYGYSAAFDLEGKRFKEFKGGNDAGHYAEFIAAAIKGDPSAVSAPARCGALSAGLSHLGNISYYMGENNKLSVADIKKALDAVKSFDQNEETLDRTVEHLKANGVDLDKYKMSLGPMLKFDPEKEVFVGDRADEANALATREYRAPYVVPEIS